MRNILLLEPGYKNKYPPIGLMKIATYHRLLGDRVTFFKGDPKELVVDDITSQCLHRLSGLPNGDRWSECRGAVRSYIRTGKSSALDAICSAERVDELPRQWLKHFSRYFRNREYAKTPRFDRVYVTTLFTFYWNVSIKAIQSAKLLVKDPAEVKVGGVLASLLPEELEAATGIRPFQGLLDRPAMLDPNNIIIDDLPLDYSILDEIDYVYPTGSAYFTFMTKGCTRTCSFCSVPILEPTYKEKVPTFDKFKQINLRFGEQQNLLLMDNNVLASPKFPEIIEEIKSMGFHKDATFVEPNQLDIAIANLTDGYNDPAYIRRTLRILRDFTKVRRKEARDAINKVVEAGLNQRNYASKDELLSIYPLIKDAYEASRNKFPKKRHVDFNQGTDARYVTEENMRLLSEIPIYPLRIAFDHISLRKVYVEAVRLAAKYGIHRLSNYLLFNFNDKPEDLYNRMKINIDLSEELGIEIYSFPMKFIPLFGEEAKHRRYIGKHWNKKFIRAIQCISNASRGIVPSGKDFFERAYGTSVDEFHELLYMPEAYLIYRKRFEQSGDTENWRRQFTRDYLGVKGLDEVRRIIRENDFSAVDQKGDDPRIRRVLRHYVVDVRKGIAPDSEFLETRQEFEDLITNDRFVDLTLTYDYEAAITI